MASAKATAGASCRWHTPIFMKSTMERMSRHVASVRFCLSVVFWFSSTLKKSTNSKIVSRNGSSAATMRSCAASSTAPNCTEARSRMRMRSAMICFRSSSPFSGDTQISVKRLRSAALSSFLPKSPPGFIVARMRNLGCAVYTSMQSPPFSGTVICRSLSRMLFMRSSTASSASEISSSRKMSPRFIVVSSGPSCHTKICWYFPNASRTAASCACCSAVSSPACAASCGCNQLITSDGDSCRIHSWYCSGDGASTSMLSCGRSHAPSVATSAQHSRWKATASASCEREGRCPPRMSLVSVCAWQFRITSRWRSASATSCTAVVLPQPVPPTSSTGSS